MRAFQVINDSDGAPRDARIERGVVSQKVARQVAGDAAVGDRRDRAPARWAGRIARWAGRELQCR